MYSTKTVVIEMREFVESVYNTPEEYKEHAAKLKKRGYSQQSFMRNGINHKIYASYTKEVKKEFIPRITGNNYEI